MANSLRQVYASVYIDENELQILVAEYFNTRFNIIRADKFKMEGILNFRITDYNRVVEILKGALEYSSNRIGATINKVILVLPSLDFVRYPLRVSVIPNGGILTKKDVAKAVTSALNEKINDSSTIVNANVVKYNINGISSRRLPEKEICDEVLIDIDLLCANKEMCYSYVKAVSDAGVNVLDITLNNYSICKEAVLLEQSLDSNIILLDIGLEHTYMSLLTKGKLVSSELIYDGLSSLCEEVYKELHIPKDNIERLIKYNVSFEDNVIDNAIFAWNDDKQINHSITVKELSKIVYSPLKTYIDKIMTMCKPIIDSGETSFFLVGEGSKMKSLVDMLKNESNIETKTYFPDTIGVRDSSMSAIYGSFIVYKEKAMLNDLNVCCVDVAEYDNTVDQREEDNEGESITSKIKKMFDDLVHEEEEN